MEKRGKAAIVYDSGYGATASAAKTISSTLTGLGIDVIFFQAGQRDLPECDRIFIGSPIRLGRCTPEMKSFLIHHSDKLVDKKVFLFFTCMNVSSDITHCDFPVFADPQFREPNKPKTRSGLMEATHTTSYYLKHLLKLIPGIAPAAVAFFKGRLDTDQLPPLYRFIMRIAMLTMPEIQNGDFLKHETVESWVHAHIDF